MLERNPRDFIFGEDNPTVTKHAAGELLKSSVVVSFRRVRTDIRSLRFLQQSRLIFYLVAS